MSKLYAVSNTQKSAQQEAREAVNRYIAKQRRREVDDLRAATVREGTGMKWTPSEFRFWWNAFVIRPERGQIASTLYPKTWEIKH